MTSKLNANAKCPQCGATCKAAKVIKDRTSRIHHFYCECGKHFAEAWTLYWPDRWVRQQEG